MKTPDVAFHNDDWRMAVVLSAMGIVAFVDFSQKPVIVMPFYWAVIMVAATFVKWRYTVALSIIAIILSAIAGREWGYLTSPDYLVRIAMGLVLSVIAALLSKQLEERDHRLTTMSFTDSLTGLPNRILLYERLNFCLRQRNPINPIVVVFVDLDDFKSVNDEYGHDAGDTMLREVGHRLTEIVRSEDTAARLGGDEFVIFCTSIADATGAEALCKRLSHVLKQPFQLGDHEVIRGGSVGCVVTSRHDLDAEHLVNLADRALLETKKSKKGGYHLVNLNAHSSESSD